MLNKNLKADQRGRRPATSKRPTCSKCGDILLPDAGFGAVCIACPLPLAVTGPEKRRPAFGAVLAVAARRPAAGRRRWAR